MFVMVVKVVSIDEMNLYAFRFFLLKYKTQFRPKVKDKIEIMLSYS